MKRKILISGKNQVVVDEFFYNMSDVFECQTTSMRSEDIVSHCKYFAPEMFVYCLRDEGGENVTRFTNQIRWLTRMRIPYTLIGNSDDCAAFAQEASGVPALVLEKPITAAVIAENIVKYLEEKEKEAAQAEALERERLEREKQAQEQARRKHVTVIDDDPRMLKVIKEYLHEEYDVAVAVSGKIGLRFLESKPTDIILLDYVMPEMDGPEVYAQIKEIPEHSETPIIFLTGMSEKDKIQKVMALHPQGYLLKPVERDRLISTIKEIIG